VRGPVCPGGLSPRHSASDSVDPLLLDDAASVSASGRYPYPVPCFAPPPPPPFLSLPPSLPELPDVGRGRKK